MTRKRKKEKSKTIHSNTLKPSILVGGKQSPVPIEILARIYPGLDKYTQQKDRQWDVSMLEAAFVIQEKFLEVSQLYFKRWECPLPIPNDVKSDILLWRTLFFRYRNGDFRHTEDERVGMARFAQWTVDEQRKLKNQEPVVVDMLHEGV